MPTLSITKTYSNGNVLSESDLDNIKNSIETFINSTKLDGFNIQISNISEEVGTTMSTTGADAVAATMSAVGADAIAGKITATASNSIASRVTTWTQATADAIGVAMSATGANAVFADVNSISATSANLVGTSMTHTGANAAGLQIDSQTTADSIVNRSSLLVPLETTGISTTLTTSYQAVTAGLTLTNARYLFLVQFTVQYTANDTSALVKVRTSGGIDIGYFYVGHGNVNETISGSFTVQGTVDTGQAVAVFASRGPTGTATIQNILLTAIKIKA